MAASMMKKASSSIGLRRAAPHQARVVRASAATRPTWFPGNAPPAWLTGELAGDYGFDPLHLSEEPGMQKWMVQAELVHCRWAMLGVAGILFTSVTTKLGGGFGPNGFPDWYDAGKDLIGTAPLGTLIFTELLLFGWVETKRLQDLRNPGSQGDGSFLGVTDALKGKENGYPGGPWFDPFGFSRGDAKMYKKYKQNEITNGVTFATNGVSVPHFSEFS